MIVPLARRQYNPTVYGTHHINNCCAIISQSTAPAFELHSSQRIGIGWCRLCRRATATTNELGPLRRIPFIRTPQRSLVLFRLQCSGEWGCAGLRFREKQISTARRSHTVCNTFYRRLYWRSTRCDSVRAEAAAAAGSETIGCARLQRGMPTAQPASAHAQVLIRRSKLP